MRSCTYGNVYGDTAGPKQVSSVGIVEPAGHTIPAAQGRHVDALVAATVLEKVPAGHCVQVLTVGAPVAMLYVPAMQLVQFAGLAAPARIPYVPKGQRVHAEEELAPTVTLYVPGTQAEQEEGASAYVPAGQLEDDSEQVDEPDVLYEPTAHDVQGATPPSPKVPGRQPRVSLKLMPPPDCANVRIPPRERVVGGGDPAGP